MQQSTEDDIAAIRAIKLAMAQAQDIETFAAPFDDAIVLYDMLDDSAFGKSEAMQKIAGQFAKVSNIRTQHLDLRIEVVGDVAYVLSVQNFISDRTGGGSHDFNFRGTDIFVRKQGEWKLVHKHLSVPFDLENSKILPDSRTSVSPDKR